MNKDFFKGLPGSRQTNDLKGLVVAGSAIAITDPLVWRPHDFFDLVIAPTVHALKYCPAPDIYIHYERKIDVDGALWLPRALDDLKNTLIVVNKEAARLLEVRGARPKNYMVATDEHDWRQIATQTARILGVGDESIWFTEGEDEIKNRANVVQKQSEFFGAKNKYGIPTNLRSTNRKLIMEQ